MKWFKDNWLLVLLGLVVSVVLYLQFNPNTNLYDKLMLQYNAQSKAHAAQIDALEKVNAEWRAEREKLDVEYNERLEDIQNDFNEQLAAIAKQRLKERRSLLRAAKNDPTILTRAVRRTFGIPTFKPKEKKKQGTK